jgi:hypothetical protein
VNYPKLIEWLADLGGFELQHSQFVNSL